MTEQAQRLLVAFTVLRDDGREQSFGNAVQLIHGTTPTIEQFMDALHALRELEAAGHLERMDVVA